VQIIVLTAFFENGIAAKSNIMFSLFYPNFDIQFEKAAKKALRTRLVNPYS